MNLCMKESFSSDLSQLAVDVLPNAEVFLIPGVGQGTTRPIRATGSLLLPHSTGRERATRVAKPRYKRSVVGAWRAVSYGPER